MIKSIILLINILGFLICKLFFLPSVDVSQSMPFAAALNTSFVVQIAINKGDVKGFGKFTEHLPAGFKAAVIDDQGAKTSFDPQSQNPGAGGIMQFSWDSLPPDGIINISFRVDVSSAAASGKDTLTGKFFYMADNQKLETDAMPSYINISGTPTDVPTGPYHPDTVKKGLGDVFTVRTFPASSVPPNSDIAVTLTLHRKGVSGFAKVEETIPEGFTAAGINLKGSSFTFVDNVAKFVWQKLPDDSVISVSYRLIAGSNISGTKTISGAFSYLYNNMPQIYSMGTVIFNTTGAGGNANPANSANPPTPPDSVSSANATNPVQNVDTSLSLKNAVKPTNPFAASNQTAQPGYSVKGKTLELTTTPSQSHDTESSTANKQTASQQTANLPNSSLTPLIPAPQTGLNYRVQIMALHNPVELSYFSLKRNINLFINTEQIGGFTKYTVGNYPDYKTVRDERENFRSRGIKGPFVVSYNSGVRITVQEALMISHQQWYK